MTTAGPRILLAAATPTLDYVGDSFLQEFPCYAVRRLHAALTSADLNAEVAVVEVSSENIQDLDEAIEGFRPDVLGCSVYVWSFPTLLRAAQRAKEVRPECLVVFGGPSAAPSMFELPPYRGKQVYVDALAVGEGETTLQEIVGTWPHSRETLRNIQGLRLPGPEGWHDTPARESLPPLDSLGSPYRLGLMPQRRMVYLETSRGCPFECLFCSWVAGGTGVRTMSTGRLQDELEALKQYNPELTYLIDAGLNLNRQAFKNLRAAERAADFLPGRRVTCEVYPVGVTTEHLDFLARAQVARVGIGVQSLNPEVLHKMHRPVKTRDLRKLVNDFAAMGNVISDIELILGLPGDSPKSFRNTLDTVRDMPCNVRVYQALALPGALMDRAPVELAVEFDPHTLVLSSCLGWSETELQRERERLSELVTESGRGVCGQCWWFFEPFTISSPSHQSAGAVSESTHASDVRR